MHDTPLFAVRGLSFSYGRAPVLNGISLEIPEGRFFGILGPNGSGKTTLLDILAGIKQPGSGKVMFRGQELSGIPRAKLARELALVPQEFLIHFPFSVEEVAFMGRHPHIARFASPGPADRAAVQNALAALELESLAQKQVTELSGGEKQRVVLARAWAQEAPVTLLDEPTSNLDINHTLSVLGALKHRVRRLGHSVVVILHDLNLAAAFCDQIALMKEGAVRFAGPSSEALTGDAIREVFGVDAVVRWDDFAGARQVVMQIPEARP